MHAKYLLIVEPLLTDVAFSEAFDVIGREFWFCLDFLIASLLQPQRQTRHGAIWRGSAAQDIFKYPGRIFKAARVDGHPHQFRHTTAKRLLVAGVPVGHVASLLGHSVAICERHYSKWIPERQAAIDRAIRATWKA